MGPDGRADVEAPVRTFTPEQAGIMVVAVAAAAGEATTSSAPSTVMTAADSQSVALGRGRTKVRGRLRANIVPPIIRAVPSVRYGSMGPSGRA